MFTFEWTGLDELERELRAADGELGTVVRDGLDEALHKVADDLRAAHPFEDHTNKLRDSIDGRVTSAGTGGADGVLEATADHASHVECGTSPHDIVPRRANVLHWEDGGEDHFARRVRHPGTAPTRFLERAAERAADLAAANIDRGAEHALRSLA